MWLQSYKTYFKTLRKVPKKLRFRRVLRLLSSVSKFLNHPEPHAALLAEAALVGYLHEFFGKVNLEVETVAAYAGFMRRASVW
jgi:hypothetical protein